MPQGSPLYLPDPEAIDEAGGTDPTATFDGAGTSENAAIVFNIYANVDVEIFVEASGDGGSTWETVQTGFINTATTEFEDTFEAPSHTQLNHVPVEVDARRIRIENVDTVAGECWVDGREAVSSN